ncbi:MAG: type I restriction-modification system subunit M N-terminal domain-containing protein [Chloroflexota bacterium]
MVANHTDLEKRLWSAAHELRANSKLRGSQYSMPVLGLIFFEYAEHRFLHVKDEIEENTSARRRQAITPDTYKREADEQDVPKHVSISSDIRDLGQQTAVLLSARADSHYPTSCYLGKRAFHTFLGPRRMNGKQ